jgi:hypothetical protein
MTIGRRRSSAGTRRLPYDDEDSIRIATTAIHGTPAPVDHDLA